MVRIFGQCCFQRRINLLLLLSIDLKLFSGSPVVNLFLYR